MSAASIKVARTAGAAVAANTRVARTAGAMVARVTRIGKRRAIGEALD
jgi:hypothetical protein